MLLKFVNKEEDHRTVMPGGATAMIMAATQWNGKDK